MSIGTEDVKKVGRLARIHVTEDDCAKWLPQLTNIIGFVEQLAEVDTDHVEPLASVVDITLPLRHDVVNDGDCVERVLKNAPESTQGYFVVPKVVE